MMQVVAETYRKTSNISRTLVGNKIVDNSDAPTTSEFNQTGFDWLNSDVVGASPVGPGPTTFST